jgi:hypothetical protein
MPKATMPDAPNGPTVSTKEKYVEEQQQLVLYRPKPGRVVRRTRDGVVTEIVAAVPADRSGESEPAQVQVKDKDKESTRERDDSALPVSTNTPAAITSQALASEPAERQSAESEPSAGQPGEMQVTQVTQVTGRRRGAGAVLATGRGREARESAESEPTERPAAKGRPRRNAAPAPLAQLAQSHGAQATSQESPEERFRRLVLRIGTETARAILQQVERDVHG